MAISDELGLTAQPLEVLKRTTLQSDISHLKRIVENYEVREIVYGFPRNMDGSVGPQADKVMGFVSELAGSLEVPLYPWDERLTTKAAERVLIRGDVSRSKRKKVVDKLAAVLILQAFLDRRRMGTLKDVHRP